MSDQTGLSCAHTEIVEQYPLYLRWGQLVALYADLELGSRWVVVRHLREGKIERVRLYGGRDHYTRSSVVAAMP